MEQSHLTSPVPLKMHDESSPPAPLPQAPAPEPSPADPSPRRPIRSFVLRAGRMGTGQQRALQDLGPRFVLPFQATPLDPAAVFGRKRMP